MCVISFKASVLLIFIFLFKTFQIVEIVGTVITDICMMMKPLDFEKRNEKDANNDPLATGTTMFEFFLALQKLDMLV